MREKYHFLSPDITKVEVVKQFPRFLPDGEKVTDVFLWYLNALLASMHMTLDGKILELMKQGADEIKVHYSKPKTIQEGFNAKIEIEAVVTWETEYGL